MRTNLSSQISLNHVSPRYYKPENAVERSVLTRLEKIPTDIFETIEEGVRRIADEVAAKIQERQREGKFCTLAIGTGTSLRPLFTELVRRHKDEGLSFRNVVVFNLYEFYPLTEGNGSTFGQLNSLFLSQTDIDRQNVAGHGGGNGGLAGGGGGSRRGCRGSGRSGGSRSCRRSRSRSLCPAHRPPPRPPRRTCRWSRCRRNGGFRCWSVLMSSIKCWRAPCREAVPTCAGRPS